MSRFYPGLLLLLLVSLPVRAQLLYVDDSATGLNDGSSWANAYVHLQDALAAATNGTKIRVARGTYHPDRGAGQTPGSRDATFQLKAGVDVLGGYAGVGHPNPDQRNAAEHVTTLSGDLGAPGAAGDNAYHVVTGHGTNAVARLDGFTISGGNADGGGFNGAGGGIRNAGGRLVLANLVVTGNTAHQGGGLYNASGAAVLNAVTFADNGAFGSGGGLYNTAAELTLTDVVFTKNQASGLGGGAASDESWPTLNDVTFTGNSVSGGGGGLSISPGGTLRGVTFTDNYAMNAGGGLYFNGNPSLVDVTFTNNHTAGEGGGLSGAGDASLIDVTFVGNGAHRGGGLHVGGGSRLVGAVLTDNTAFYGGGLYLNVSLGDTLALANVVVERNQAAFGGGIAVGGMGAYRLVNATLAGNEATGSGGGLYSTLPEGSAPQVRNTILWGNTAQADGPFVETMGGRTRFAGSIVQGGVPAYGTEDAGGNLDQDPRFVDAAGGDLRLLAGSPALDAGVNHFLPADDRDLDRDGDLAEYLPYDVGGHARVTDNDGDPSTPAVVDVGAYEAPAGVQVAPRLVLNTNDSGPGSLRAALLDANAHPGLDRIAFRIGSGGAATITPLAPLPALADSVVLDGTTQPGYDGTPLITLSGLQAGSGAAGLTLTGTGSTVRGLAFHRFGGAGLLLSGGGRHTLTANVVGTDSSGTTPLGNGAGILVSGSHHNTIGGSGPGEGNTVAFNAGPGIAVVGAAAVANTVRGNALYANDGLGIDLGADGVDGQDGLDGDGGPNDLQNAPVLSFAGPTLVVGSLSAAPGETYTVDLYASPAADASGYGEGRHHLGVLAVTTGLDGTAPFTLALGQPLPAGSFVTATATASGGSTSEFGRARRSGAVTPAVLYLSPDATSTWVPGTTRTIRWLTPGQSGGTVRLQYRRGDSPLTTIVAATDNDGAFDWTLPETLAPGDDYRVRIVTGGGTSSEYSGFFSVAPASHLALLAPAPGDAWPSGSTQAIRWQSGGAAAGGTVRLRFLQGSNTPVLIAAETENDGHYEWTVPEGLLPASDYRIRLSKNGAPGYIDYSGSFTVPAEGTPAIALASPVAGEVYAAGSVLPVRWSTTGMLANETVTIYVTRPGGLKLKLGKTSNDGSFDWAIPPGQELGDHYHVRVLRTSDPAVTVLSGAVTIVAPGAAGKRAGDVTPVEPGWTYVVSEASSPMPVQAWLGRRLALDREVVVAGTAGTYAHGLFPADGLAQVRPGERVAVWVGASPAYPGGHAPEGRRPPLPARRHHGAPAGGSGVMLVYAEVPDLADGDEVGAWRADGTLAGSAVVDGGKALLAVWGDEDAGAAVPAALSLKAWRRSTGTALHLVPADVADLDAPEGAGRVRPEPGADGLRFEAETRVQALLQVGTEAGPVPAEDAALPASMRLGEAYPNPFNPQTVIPFELPQRMPVRLVVYDALGREVARLFDDVAAAGRHEVRFDAAGLPSGVYLVRLSAGGAGQTRTVTAVR